MTWEELKVATKCVHEKRTPVRFVKSNGVISVRLQCQHCGYSGSDVPKNGYRVEDLPLFDPTLGERWDTWCDDLRKRTYTEQEALRQAAQQAAAVAWWKGYNVYLKSAHWQAVRRKVIQRDGFVCQLCFKRVTEADAHAHHLSYATYDLVGMSLPAECVALCRSCHERIEAAKHPDEEEW